MAGLREEFIRSPHNLYPNFRSTLLPTLNRIAQQQNDPALFEEANEIWTGVPYLLKDRRTIILFERAEGRLSAVVHQGAVGNTPGMRVVVPLDGFGDNTDQVYLAVKHLSEYLGWVVERLAPHIRPNAAPATTASSVQVDPNQRSVAYPVSASLLQDGHRSFLTFRTTDGVAQLDVHTHGFSHATNKRALSVSPAISANFYPALLKFLGAVAEGQVRASGGMTPPPVWGTWGAQSTPQASAFEKRSRLFGVSNLAVSGNSAERPQVDTGPENVTLNHIQITRKKFLAEVNPGATATIAPGVTVSFPEIQKTRHESGATRVTAPVLTVVWKSRRGPDGSFFELPAHTGDRVSLFVNGPPGAVTEEDIKLFKEKLWISFSRGGTVSYLNDLLYAAVSPPWEELRTGESLPYGVCQQFYDGLRAVFTQEVTPPTPLAAFPPLPHCPPHGELAGRTAFTRFSDTQRMALKQYYTDAAIQSAEERLQQLNPGQAVRLFNDIDAYYLSGTKDGRQVRFLILHPRALAYRADYGWNLLFYAHTHFALQSESPTIISLPSLSSPEEEKRYVQHAVAEALPPMKQSNINYLRRLQQDGFTTAPDPEQAALKWTGPFFIPRRIDPLRVQNAAREIFYDALRSYFEFHAIKDIPDAASNLPIPR